MNQTTNGRLERFEKVEFPTFLEQPPTIIFGRNGRELLLLACGGALALTIWQSTGLLQSSLAGIVLAVLLCLLPMGLAALLAFVRIGARPLEEWAFVLLAYALAPKLSLYAPYTAEEHQAAPPEHEEPPVEQAAAEAGEYPY